MPPSIDSKTERALSNAPVVCCSAEAQERIFRRTQNGVRLVLGDEASAVLISSAAKIMRRNIDLSRTICT